MILFSMIILTTMIPILTSNYYRSSNSRTLSTSATAAIPDRDDDERPCCYVHTFAAATTTAVVEVTIGYSAHSFGRRRILIWRTRIGFTVIVCDCRYSYSSIDSSTLSTNSDFE